MKINREFTKSKKISYDEIDAELIPLVRELNKVGLKTTQCCIGHKEKEQAYLAINIKNIRHVVISNDPKEPYQRLIIYWDKD